MALTSKALNSPVGALELVQTSATSTLDKNITGGTTGNLIQVDIDNSNNPTTAVYVKFKDATDGDTGSNPDWIFYAPGGQRTSYTCMGASPFTIGLIMWCVTGAAGTSSTSPTGTVSVRVLVGAN